MVSVRPSPAEGGPYAPNPVDGSLVKGHGQIYVRDNDYRPRRNL
jgi:hypothetical protein